MPSRVDVVYGLLVQGCMDSARLPKVVAFTRAVGAAADYEDGAVALWCLAGAHRFQLSGWLCSLEELPSNLLEALNSLATAADKNYNFNDLLKKFKSVCKNYVEGDADTPYIPVEIAGYYEGASVSVDLIRSLRAVSHNHQQMGKQGESVGGMLARESYERWLHDPTSKTFLLPFGALDSKREFVRQFFFYFRRRYDGLCEFVDQNPQLGAANPYQLLDRLGSAFVSIGDKKGTGRNVVFYVRSPPILLAGNSDALAFDGKKGSAAHRDFCEQLEDLLQHLEPGEDPSQEESTRSLRYRELCFRFQHGFSSSDALPDGWSFPELDVPLMLRYPPEYVRLFHSPAERGAMDKLLLQYVCDGYRALQLDPTLTDKGLAEDVVATAFAFGVLKLGQIDEEELLQVATEMYKLPRFSAWAGATDAVKKSIGASVDAGRHAEYQVDRRSKAPLKTHSSVNFSPWMRQFAAFSVALIEVSHRSIKTGVPFLQLWDKFYDVNNIGRNEKPVSFFTHVDGTKLLRCPVGKETKDVQATLAAIVKNRGLHGERRFGREEE